MKIDSIQSPVYNEQGEVATPGDNLFETLVGLGLEEKGITRAEYDNGRWYDHNVERFGTKWDPSREHFDNYGFEIDGDDATLSLQVTTAWDSCYPFACLLSKRYDVAVNLTAEEGGNDFYYKIKIEDGEVIDFDNYSWSQGHYIDDEEYFWESIVEDAMEYVWGDETENAHEVLRKQFDYVNKKDMEEILEMYDQYVKEQEKEEAE
jgi:hypothetical protein